MRNTHRYGFTLIEVLIYIGIVVIVLGSLIPFAWNAIGIGEKSATQREVDTQARYVSERLKYEIRNASDINTGSSNFGVDLASNPSAQLSLAESVAANNPTVFKVTTNGIVQITRGAQAPVNLNSTDTKITDLTFTNYSSADSKTKQIGCTLTMSQAASTTRAEFQETVTIETSSELRSN